MLDTLEELGYLGRARAVGSDQRQVYVSLTPAVSRRSRRRMPFISIVSGYR